MREDSLEPVSPLSQTSEVLLELSTTTCVPFLARLGISQDGLGLLNDSTHQCPSVNTRGFLWQGQSGIP